MPQRGGSAGCSIVRIDSEGAANQAGVTVARMNPPCNPAGLAFEDTGLQGILAVHHDLAPDAMGRAILEGVEAHAGDARLADDLTALVLRRKTPII